MGHSYTLNLYGIDLNIALSNIPADATSINLTSSNLYTRSLEELIQIFRAFPEGILAVNLTNNYLANIPIEYLIQVFAILAAKGVTSINLSNNNFETLLTNRIVEIFTVLPVGLTIIDLSENDLGSKSLGELVRIFASLPAGLTSINLNYNNLFKSAAGLAQVLAALPTTMESIDLSDNNLSTLSADELVQIFTTLPYQLKRLYLSKIDFATPEAQAAFLAKIPIREVYIDKQVYVKTWSPERHQELPSLTRSCVATLFALHQHGQEKARNAREVPAGSEQLIRLPLELLHLTTELAFP